MGFIARACCGEFVITVWNIRNTEVTSRFRNGAEFAGPQRDADPWQSIAGTAIGDGAVHSMSLSLYAAW